ncbi:MAG: hypothetical protein WCA20_28045 [Candidatus Sulfotelmatobacter sp.]
MHYLDFDRAVQERDRAKAEEDYLRNYVWRIGDVVWRPLADHAPVNYVWPVTAATP